MERTELFVCECGDVSHQLILSTLETEKDEKRVVYAAFHLDNYGFLNRVKAATRYLLGINRRDGDFDNLLFKREDIGRLKCFADYLNLNPNDVHQKPVAKDNVKNGSKLRWQYTTLCSWDFCSNDNVYRFAVERHECLNDKTLSGIESSISVSMKSGNLFYRLCRVVKHVFGYRSCYGGFDSFEINEEDADKLHNFIRLSALRKQ